MGNACCCSTSKINRAAFEDYAKRPPIQRTAQGSSKTQYTSPNITLIGSQINQRSGSQFQQQDNYSKGSIFNQTPSAVPNKDTQIQKSSQGDLSRFNYQKQFSWATIHESHQINQRISSEDIRKIYEIGKEIGAGRYGVVRIAQKHSHPKKRFAVKSIPRDTIKTDIHLLEQELDILKSADHPNIINFYEIYKDRQFFHLVTEFCEGGELFEYIVDREKIPEKESALIMSKVVSAILNLHQRNISHRDLKPENILFEAKGKHKEIKVIDFGLSKYFQEDMHMTTKLGTPYYVSPEVLEGKYDKSCDIWSIGVMTYIMLCGYPPFNAPNENQLFRKILCCDYEFKDEDWEDISDDAKNFIRGCLQPNSQRRMTAQEAIIHPWLKKNYQTLLQQNPCKEVLMRLRNFKKSSKLQFEVLKVLGSILGFKEIQNIKDTFYAIDTNLSGSISREELRDILLKEMILQPDEDVEAVTTEIFENIDFDQSGEINYSEFLVATLDPQLHLKREIVWNAFKYFDADDCDCLSFSGLKKVFLRSGRLVKDEEIQAIFKEVNIEINESITFRKFSDLFESYGGGISSPTTTGTTPSLQNSFREDFDT